MTIIVRRTIPAASKPAFLPHAIHEDLTVRLSQHKDPVRAAGARKYMRNQFHYLGVDATTRRTVVKDILRGYAVPTQVQMMELAETLWDMPQREYQYAAIDILKQYRKMLNAGFLSEAEPLITCNPWWDTVDALSGCVNHVVAVFPDTVEVMHEWVRDENIWIARTSILHQLGRKKDTDPVRLEQILSQRLNDKEFFIAKAIGWALRDYSYTNPDFVTSFTQRHDMQALTRREALRALTRRGTLDPKTL